MLYVYCVCRPAAAPAIWRLLPQLVVMTVAAVGGVCVCVATRGQSARRLGHARLRFAGLINITVVAENV